MSSVPVRDPEELLRHTAWVRALAASVLEDASYADDVVQEMWVAALTRPPKKPGALRSWLAAVTLNVARLHRRSEARRDRRECASAVPERLASAADIAEHEAERQRTVDIVLRLPEPYRATILLRFWNGLTPAAIAERLDLPASTVRNRLSRGLARVRAEFEREGTGAAQRRLGILLAFVPAAKAPVATSVAATFLGGVLVSLQLKVVAASVVVVALTWGLSSLLDPPIDVPIPEPGPSADLTAPQLDAERTLPEPQVLAIDPATPATGSARVAVQPSERPTSTAYGIVTDPRGLPVPDALVRFVAAEEEERSARTLPNDGYRIEELPQREWRVLCSAQGFRPVELPATLDGPNARIDLALEPVVQIGVRFMTDDGESLDTALGQQRDRVGFLLGDSLLAIANAQPPDRRIAVETNPRDWVGHGRYEPLPSTRHPRERTPPDDAPATEPAPEPDGVLTCDIEPPLFVSAVLRNVVLQTQRVDPGDEMVTFRLSLDDLTDLGTTIRGRVIDAESGLGLEDVRISASNATSVRIGAVDSDRGHFEMKGQPFGRVGFWLRCSGYRPSFQFLDLEPGEVRDLGTLELDRSESITGRVVAANRAAPPTWLHVFDLDSLLPEHRMPMNIVFEDTDEFGEFDIDAGTGRQLIVARPKQREFGLAATIVDPTEGPVVGVEIEVRPAVEVTLAPHYRQAVIARVLDEAGRPLWADQVSREPWALPLAEGEYRVEIVEDGEVVQTVAFEVATVSCRVDLIPPVQQAR